VWLVVVPLMLGGTEVAHALAYRLVYPQAVVRWRVLAETGHGYLGWAPLVLGVGAALVLVGVLAALLDAVGRGDRHSAPPVWVLGLLPILGYAMQEFLERWVALGGFPWWMVEQPTFRIGLLLQLPFALTAFLVARLLLRVAENVGRALRSAALPFRLVGPVRTWFPLGVFLSRLPALAAGHAERGPPPVLVVLAR
jgi:hypothetical protein